jgi:hypothetical protein
MSLKERRLEIGRVAESGQRLVQVALVPEPSTWGRFTAHDAGPDIVGAGQPQQLARSLQEDRRDRRVEGTARPAGDGRAGHRGAADRVEHRRRKADRGEPRRRADVLTGQARWRPSTVEAFERAQNGVTYGLGQPQPLREIGPDLTVGPSRLSDNSGHPWTLGQDPQLVGAVAQPGQEPDRFHRPSRVDQIPACANNHVIAAERGGRFVRGRRATREAHQTGVEHLALRPGAVPCSACQFGRQQARAHRFTRRMPSSQITGHGQCRDHTGEANLAGHSASLGD